MLQLRTQYKAEPLEGAIKLTLNYYRKNKVRADVDNLAKTTMDAMTGLVYVDDVQIVDLHITKAVDASNPRVEITLERIDQ